MTFKEIKQRNSEELERMNRLIRQSLVSGNDLLDHITSKYLEVNGKQLRPLIVIISAKIFGDINENVLRAGASIEMLHNASLIHDDVVDETLLRRGRKTINAIWDNRIAVLVGDYFVSKALSVGLGTENLVIIDTISKLGEELSLGEINQINNVREHHFSQSRYLEMIKRKTASLFVSCAKVGAASVGAAEADYAPLLEFSNLLGLCFQIKDDILDYCGTPEIGKPTGNDLREGKVTLPLIHALDVASPGESEEVKKLLMQSELNEQQINFCIEFAKTHGGIDYSYAFMERLKQKAFNIIDTFTDSESKENLKLIFEYIIKRSY